MGRNSPNPILTTPSPPHIERRDLAIVVALVLTVALFDAALVERESIVAAGHRAPKFSDDAYISMRYARNLANGHDLRWNANERPVEGITNLLWTLWMALLALFMRDPSTAVAASAALATSGVRDGREDHAAADRRRQLLAQRGVS